MGKDPRPVEEFEGDTRGAGVQDLLGGERESRVGVERPGMERARASTSGGRTGVISPDID